jgi:hypothetical protein
LATSLPVFGGGGGESPPSLLLPELLLLLLLPPLLLLPLLELELELLDELELGVELSWLLDNEAEDEGEVEEAFVDEDEGDDVAAAVVEVRGALVGPVTMSSNTVSTSSCSNGLFGSSSTLLPTLLAPTPSLRRG